MPATERGVYAPVPKTVRVRRLATGAGYPATWAERMVAQRRILLAVYGSNATPEDLLTVGRIYAELYPVEQFAAGSAAPPIRAVAFLVRRLTGGNR